MSKVYRQKLPPQKKLPNGITIMVLGIVGISAVAAFGASIVMYIIVKNKIREEMPIFMESPLAYKKSYKLMYLGSRLALAGLWISIGFLIFWAVYFTMVFTFFGTIAGAGI